jgi:hypothetical protein
MADKLVYTTETIICDTPEKMTQYRRACIADAKREREGERRQSSQSCVAQHDTEFVSKVLFIPRELLGFRLTKDDLRLLVVA